MDLHSDHASPGEECVEPRPPTRRSGTFSLSKKLKKKESKDALPGDSEPPMPTPRLTRSKTTAFKENILDDFNIDDKGEEEAR